jgi:hypothetical protein
MLRDEPRRVEASLDVSTRSGTEAPPFLRSTEQPRDRVAQRHGVVALHEDSCLAIDNDVRHTADGARHDCNSGARSFKQRESQALAFGRMHEQVEPR